MKDLLYFQKLHSLLTMEYEAEKAEFRNQIDEMGLGRRIRRGLCWWPVSVGKSYYNSLNQYVVEILKADDDEEIEHSFEYGRPIVFFSENDEDQTSTGSAYNINERARKGNASAGAKKKWSKVCQISYVDDKKMVVVVPSVQMVQELEAAASLGVQLYFDETSYRTMFHALNEVMKAKNNRLQSLTRVFSGIDQPGHWTFNDVKFPWLNASQEKAVNEVLRAKDVAIVHGPPGTGKTTTLVEAIYETLKRETQVLVCAQSNMAVDWISEKLVDRGVSVLRIGNPTRVNDKMLSFTYERKFESHPDYPELWNIRRAIRQIKESRKKGDGIHQKLARLRERADEIEFRIRDSLFVEARVVACTLVGADNRLLIGKKFPTLFIDEAAQALEPACWIAIRRAHRVVFAGDHKQLPPTVKCYEALKEGLGVTLMERIVENVPECVTLLKMQYRMNEQIMRFSSHWFYEDSVESSPVVKHRSILDYDTPITWIETEDKEEFIGETHGRINKPEAELTIQTLEKYVEHVGRQRFIDERMDVGVISPYRMQIQYMRSLLKQSQLLKPLRKSITINTIDGFQGQERDIIMISLVRSNERGEIGFLRDLRRMNVAMTRARMKLIIFGNSETLSRNPFYRDLKLYIDKMNENQPPLEQPLQQDSAIDKEDVAQSLT